MKYFVGIRYVFQLENLYFGFFCSLSLLSFSIPTFAVDDAALPQGGEVVSGRATIAQTRGVMTINQSSQNARLNWDSFNVGRNATVNFEQPNASAIAVNRINGPNGSQIMGSLNANGSVFLINPNGVLFGKGAQINVGGLVASTLDIDDETLGSGSLRFQQSQDESQASVINRGSISARDGGYVALLGKHVENTGVISAEMGTVAMGAGEQATLSFAGNHLLSLQVDKGVIDGLVDNSGLIQANGGQVFMTAKAANALTTAVVNHSGVIEAQTMVEREGKIILLGDMETGTTNVTGVLDASAPSSGNGGFIETSAGTVLIDDAASITTAAVGGATGQWLVDPNDYTIAATGGDISGTALAAALASSNVTLESADGASGTNGDIFVNDTVSWSSGNSLTLDAYRHIDINQSLNSTGGGNLILQSGGSVNGTGTINFGGGSIAMSGGGSVDIYYNPASYAAPTSFAANITGTYRAWMLINNVTQLQDVNTNLSGRYALAADIDASATSGWNSGAGFDPIGDSGSQFTGIFDGQDYDISSLTINRPTESQVGLFGYTGTGSRISNMTFVQGTGYIIGQNYVGSFAGLNAGTMENLYSELDVTGQASYVGGIAGLNYANISASYATGDINAVASFAGGLVGYNFGGAISQSFASGTTTANSSAGGLVGEQDGGGISESYASGDVDANVIHAGGLVGRNRNSATISDSYATGAVTGGGGATFINGFVGQADSGTFTNNFYDVTTTGQAAGAGGAVTSGIVGMTSAEMQTEANFNSATVANGGVDPSWDLSDVWRIYDGNTYPLLREFLTDITVTADDFGRVYDGAVYGGAHSATQSDPLAVLSGTLAFTTSGVNAGSYSITPSGLYSTAQLGGYDIRFVDGTQTINPATLGITGSTVANRAYNGTASGTVTAGTLSGFVGTETVNVASASGTFDDVNVGTGKNVSVTYTLSDGLNGGLASNYVLADESLMADISAANITISTSDVIRTYDGTASASGAAIVSSGALYGADTLVTGAAVYTFDNANAGVGKSVSVSGVTVNDGNGGSNYSVSFTDNTSSTINTASITVTTSDVSRTYDGTTNAAGSATLTGGTLFGGDTLDGSGAVYAFDDRNVGTGKSVSVAGVTVNDGNSGANYSITYADNVSSTISAAPITISTAEVSRTYDGTVNAAGSAIVTSGSLFGSDALDISLASFTFDNPNAGTGKSVSVAGVSVDDGNSGGNYSVSFTDNTASTVTSAPLVVSTDDINRVYDGTTAASGTAIVSSGSLYGTDSLDISGATFTFDNANAGTGKSVSVSGVTVSDSNGGSNYDVSYVNNNSSAISAAPIAISASDISRTYDGSTDASGVSVVTSGILFGTDALDNSGANFIFDNANVGTDKSVSVSGVTVTDGNGGNNYAVTYVANSSSEISAAPITITTSNINRSYDGTTLASGAAIVEDGTLFGTDALNSGSATYVFDNANVGSDKSVSVGGITIDDGNNGNNYNITFADNISSEITAAPIIISSSDVNRTYDGTVAAEGTAIVVGGVLFGSDVVDDSLARYVFDNVNVGTDKSVTISGVTVNDGNGGNNYAVSFDDNTASVIEAATITVTSTEVNRSYDGTTAAAGSAILSAGTLFGTDELNSSGASYAFDNAHAGDEKSVSVSGVSVDDGNNGRNYSILYEDNTSSTISAASITLASADVSRAYDGTTLAEGNIIITQGALFGDDLLDSSSAHCTFDSANVGTGKTIALRGVDVNDGNSGGNYVINYEDNTSSAITAAPLMVTATSGAKVYDGLEFSGGFGVDYNGFVAGENESVITGDVAYQGSAQNAVNAGSYQIELAGLQAENYNIVYASGQLEVTPAQLTYVADTAMAFTGQDLALDGSVVGLVGNDVFSDIVSGELVWRSLADVNDAPGTYEVVGEGVSVISGNYESTIVQSVRNSEALTLLSPAVVVSETVNQVIRDEEEELAPIEFASEILIDDNRKIIFDISLENHGMRLPEGLAPFSE